MKLNYEFCIKPKFVKVFPQPFVYSSMHPAYLLNIAITIQWLIFHGNDFAMLHCNNVT